MGDVYGAIQVALQTITPLINAEVFLHTDLAEDVKTIQIELSNISAFLENVEEPPYQGNNGAILWEQQVRSLAYDIEDAIELYRNFLKARRRKKLKQRILFDDRNMALNIKALCKTADTIYQSRNRYKSDKNDNERGQCNDSPGQFSTSFIRNTTIEDYEVQDLNSKSEIIKLLRGTPSVIAVVSMRGQGKTAVVSTVYRDRKIKSDFPRRAWISESERKRHVDILRSMIKQFSDASDKAHSMLSDNMDDSSLMQLLEKYLGRKRYMIVFDDVQEGDIVLAAYIKRMLNFNKKGGKILITTRYKTVAQAWLDGCIHGMYKLKPFPSENAWQLFCKKTFQSSGGICPPFLHDLARKIVSKCGGLPPAIVSAGRILSTKEHDVNEWEKVLDNLGYFLTQESFMKSYYDLPSKLKPCFLYFGLFPEGYPIGRMRLIRLWIAEGFIRKTGGNNLTLEEVAEEYISELINTNMVQVKSTDPTGKARTLVVENPILHDMILSKLEELSFCRILSRNNNAGNETYRRLSIHKNYDHNVPGFLEGIAQSKSSSTRSLFMIDVTERIIVDKVFKTNFLKSITLLKVLDLYNAPIDVIPGDIGRLLNLHYLSLRRTGVSKLPGTIGMLENLQTLDLKETGIFELPTELIQLRKLRHIIGYLYGYDSDCLTIRGVKIPEGLLGKCSELQKLAFLDVNDAYRNWDQELRSLTQLRKLGIVGLMSHQGSAMSSVIDGMKCLQSLNVFSDSKSESIDLVNVKSPPLLKRLYLNGPLSSIPTWIYDLHSLVKIRLSWSVLNADPLEKLQLLPNLMELQLLEAFTGEHIEITSHGFQKLKVLQLFELHNLKSLFIGKGALPLLDEMSIGGCKSLEMPTGIKYLSTRTKLNFIDMPSGFTDTIRQGHVLRQVLNSFVLNMAKYST